MYVRVLTFSDTGPCDYPLVACVDSVDVAILGPGAINGGANDPPGHLVASYDKTTNFLNPVLWNLPDCEGNLHIKIFCLHFRLFLSAKASCS